MRRLLAEPLLHFLLIGVALFAAFSLLSARERPDDDEIVVSAGRIEHLAALFERTWQRPATPDELRGLVDAFVREEVAYREGLAIGLARDDTIIRRRIRQKLDFVAGDLAGQAEPGEADLAAYLAAHADDFRLEPRLSFRQVYLDPARRGDRLGPDARELLARLDRDPTLEADALGDRTLLEHAHPDVTPREVAGLFGGDFAAALEELEPGRWHGPVESGYGAHLVRVDARVEARRPELAEVREAVRREWVTARREEVIEDLYRDMLARYRVRIEWPEPGGPGGGP